MLILTFSVVLGRLPGVLPSKTRPGRGGMVPGIMVPEMQVHRLEIKTARRALASVLDQQPCGGEKAGWRPDSSFPHPPFYCIFHQYRVLLVS